MRHQPGVHIDVLRVQPPRLVVAKQLLKTALVRFRELLITHRRKQPEQFAAVFHSKSRLPNGDPNGLRPRSIVFSKQIPTWPAKSASRPHFSRKFFGTM